MSQNKLHIGNGVMLDMSQYAMPPATRKTAIQQETPEILGRRPVAFPCDHTGTIESSEGLMCCWLESGHLGPHWDKYDGWWEHVKQ